jgi:ferredoxin
MATYRISVEGYEPFEVDGGRKLVKVLEENGVDISHRCGGNARCTTCNVQFTSEEPPIGDVEKDCLVEDGVLGQFRLSCQIRVDRDMELKVLSPVEAAAWDNPGGDVDEE